MYSSPYLSEAVIYNGLVFCSGKVGLDPSTGELVSEDVGEQTVSVTRRHRVLSANAV